ncbi:trimeric intracellular cation channel type 1B.1-like [Ptychodera flava]|uniref:trimeric intracellular cation channel type 1B.1-like n=1 Tax=Ptychodera flava TaxID=63121 RepID=UPI00396A939D
MGDFMKVYDEAAQWVVNLPMFPVFDVAHYILMTLALRQDSGIEFSRRNPLACWLCSMLSCFAGGVLANFLLGLPILASFENPVTLASASVIWYLVFYSPYDIFYKLTTFMPIMILVVALKEVSRPGKILSGIAQTAKLYPKAYHLMVLIGIVKASGSNWMKLFERMLRGVWIPTQNELLRPSFYTRECFIVLQKQGSLAMAQHHLVFAYTLFLVFWKVAMVATGAPDPFVQLEGLVCFIVFGAEEDKQVVKESLNSKKKKE